MSDATEHDHEHASALEGLDEETHERWHRFVEAVNEVADSHFPEGASLVFGGQFGTLGTDGQPSCLIATNLVPCGAEEALEDMLRLAGRLHDEYHGGAPRPTSTIEQDVDLANVPEHIREEAQRVAEMLGVPIEAIRYVEVADTSDLEALEVITPPGETGGAEE